MAQLPGFVLQLVVNADGTADVIVYVAENTAQLQNTVVDVKLTAAQLSALGTATGAGAGTTNFLSASRVDVARSSLA